MEQGSLEQGSLDPPSLLIVNAQLSRQRSGPTPVDEQGSERWTCLVFERVEVIRRRRGDSLEQTAAVRFVTAAASRR